VVLLLVVLLFQAVISVHTELVAVPVTVTDARGHRVTGLSREDFRIFEDGRPQPVAAFHHGDLTFTLGLLVDRSQSMRPKREALKKAVDALLQSVRPDDELFGIDFNDQVTLALPGATPFTHDPTELAAALIAVPAESQTALYDAVAAGLRHLALGQNERRALIVVSDGGDNASRRSYKEIVALARQSDAVIYTIGLLGTLPAAEEEDAGLLVRLCKDTGGIAYFPKTIDEITAMSAEIERDLREQYLLGFVPGENRDGRAFRKIAVSVSAAARGRLHVRARAGYVPAATDPGARP